MSYAIFRSQPINTLQDLSQIGSHNKREKEAYKSNPDIKLDRSKDNIELAKCDEKYVKKFYELTKEYKKEHEERMKTVRDDRKKSFGKTLSDAKNVVADELLFKSDNTFFKNMSQRQIKKWADTCMEFVYKDLGYSKEQVLHSAIHLDEKTPHIHCVVIPLVKKFDKRINSERYTISKKQYIKNNVHLSELQDKYYNRLVQAGFELDRGLKGSTAEHIKVKEFKKITRRIDKLLENNRLRNFIYELLQQLKKLFKRLLYIGTEKDRNKVVTEVTNYYDENYYNDMDVCDIAKNTTKEKELLQHIGYVKKDVYREKDDFEISV